MQDNNNNHQAMTFGVYGNTFQEKIFQALLVDKRWAEQMLEVLNVKYFDLTYLSYLAEKYFSYATKYKDFPTLQLLVTIIKDDLKSASDAALKNQIIDYLQRMRNNPDPGDLEFVKDRSLDFCRKQALKIAIEKSVEKLETDKYEDIVDIIKNAVSVGTTPSIGHDFFNDTEERFLKIERNCVATGIEQIDRKGILDGGLGKGEIGITMGATGTGKCSVPNTNICIKYAGVKINGKIYKPWHKINTQRGLIYARDIKSTDELV